MFVEFDLAGVPAFVAVRSDGTCQSFAGWSQGHFDRQVEWLEAG